MRPQRTYYAEGRIIMGHLILLAAAFLLSKLPFIAPKTELVIIYGNIVLGAVFSIICLSYAFGMWATLLISITIWMIPADNLIDVGFYSWAAAYWQFIVAMIVCAAVFSLCRVNHAQAFFSALRNEIAIGIFLIGVILPIFGLDIISAAGAAQSGVSWIGTMILSHQ